MGLSFKPTNFFDSNEIYFDAIEIIFAVYHQNIKPLPGFALHFFKCNKYSATLWFFFATATQNICRKLTLTSRTKVPLGGFRGLKFGGAL